MSKIWDKTNTKLNSLVEDYTVGNDHIVDLEFMIFDIQGSLAHAKGLKSIGILTAEELTQIEGALGKLAELASAKKVEIPKEMEDSHTFIESFLTEQIGETGKKIHTGRSRNDQALTMIRLWQLDKLAQLESSLKSLITLLLEKAKAYADVPFPGYSHTQQAMLTSVGHYLAAYAESLLDDLQSLESTKAILNKNPLGSAAGFGSNLELNRMLTTAELGFDAPIVNSLYAQNTRGKLDSIYAESMAQIMLTLNKIANDFLFFTTRELNYFDVPAELTTGSSIMPQKRNLDLLEILKGKSSRVISKQLELKNIYKDGISGYNREIQFTKEILLEITDITQSSLQVIALFFEQIKPNAKNIEDSIKKDIFSADIATQMSQDQGIPFRDAYKLAMKKAGQGEFDLQEELKKKKSLGSAGNLGLELLEERLSGFI